MKNCGSSDAVSHSTHSSVVATSLLGSVFIFIKVTRYKFYLKSFLSRNICPNIVFKVYSQGYTNEIKSNTMFHSYTLGGFKCVTVVHSFGVMLCQF